jgi:competence protein ComEA
MNEATSIGTVVPRRRDARLHRLVAAALMLALGLAATPLAASAAESKPGLSGVVNVNTASREELQLLPGVGEVRAVAIVARRKQQGGFKQVDDLLEVSGIGTAMLERLRPHLTLTGKTTARRL